MFNYALCLLMFIVYDYCNFKLTRAELIFYYERLTVRGICLTLLTDFEKELSLGGFSLLRLVRPSEIDPDRAQLLKDSTTEHLHHFSNYISSVLTKPADSTNEGSQVVSHDAFNPITAGSREQNIQIAIIPEGEVTLEQLNNIPHLTIKRLIEIGNEEGINFRPFRSGPRLVRGEYLEAIVQHRAGMYCFKLPI